MREGRLYYFVRRLVASEEDAWDVLQQTWMMVLKGIRSVKAPEQLPVWLYQVARCRAMSHWRSQYRLQTHLEENDGLDAVASPEEGTQFENAEQVHFALGRLSLPHREVLTLFFLEDLSLIEMAEVLNVAVGTVKSRLYYAKRALRAVLEEG